MIDTSYPRRLIESIKCGLDKIDKGSEVEAGYLNEKIKKLSNWWELEFDK